MGPSDPVQLDQEDRERRQLDALADQLAILRLFAEPQPTFTNHTWDGPPLTVENIRQAVASFRAEKEATPVGDAGFLPLGPPFFDLRPVGSFADLGEPVPLSHAALVHARESLKCDRRWVVRQLEAAAQAAGEAPAPYATQADLLQHLGPPTALLAADPHRGIPCELCEAAGCCEHCRAEARHDGERHCTVVTPQQLDVTTDDRAGTVEERSDREESQGVTPCPVCGNPFRGFGACPHLGR